MKAFLIIAVLGSQFFLSQNFSILNVNKKDSIAILNAQSILANAKKNYSKLNLNQQNTSQINTNLSELVRNTYNFNTLSNRALEMQSNSVFPQQFLYRKNQLVNILLYIPEKK